MHTLCIDMNALWPSMHIKKHSRIKKVAMPRKPCLSHHTGDTLSSKLSTMRMTFCHAPPFATKRASSSAPLPVRPHHFLSHAALHAYYSLLCITARKARRSKTTSYIFSNLYRKRFGTSRTIFFERGPSPLPLLGATLSPTREHVFASSPSLWVSRGQLHHTAHVNASILLLRHWSTPHSLSRTCPLVFKSLKTIGTSTAQAPPFQRLHDRSTCPPAVHCPRSPPTLLARPCQEFQVVMQHCGQQH